MGATINFYKKIQDIANSDIPVLEGSPCYKLFLHRKELCKNIDKAKVGADLGQLLELLNQYDEKIKQYLNL